MEVAHRVICSNELDIVEKKVHTACTFGGDNMGNTISWIIPIIVIVIISSVHAQ
jgi:hypothetical protein